MLEVHRFCQTPLLFSINTVCESRVESHHHRQYSRSPLYSHTELYNQMEGRKVGANGSHD
jgi:hypothetical protein